MIKNNQPLSMAEVKGYLKKEDAEGTLTGFINKFTEVKPKEAKELRTKLEELGIMKLREHNIVKIVDTMPDNQENLNKLFVETSLDEDETKKILETVKQFK
ncbi:MAG: hypothetical protein Q8P15_02220 [Nanoarchaeota archaeon]|nr:hypothetical protein [Nanoarchaeota archaeon]